MIHSYPKEYFELYEGFREGGTIRTWVNGVEKLGRRILEHNPEINLARFREKFQEVKANDWLPIASGRNAQYKKRHLICVSTYHSFDRLKALGRINTCTYDEAHVLVGNDDFSNNLAEVRQNINRNFFFTATRKVQGLTNGMNDRNLFGEVLCDIPPRKLIEAGEIVPPKIHVVKTTEIGDYDNHTMLVRTVKEGYAQHRVLVKSATEEPDNIGAKLLITTTGNKNLFELHDENNS
jgi:superfamily II DNA or RNA helicase